VTDTLSTGRFWCLVLMTGHTWLQQDSPRCCWSLLLQDAMEMSRSRPQICQNYSTGYQTTIITWRHPLAC